MTTAMFWRRNILPNGLTVLLFPRRSANTTQLSIAVEYGSNREPQEIAGVAHFLEHMLAGGSQKRIELSRSIENSGGILDFYTDHEHMMSIMDVLPGKVAEASFIISELLFSSDFEKEKFGQERKIILNELAEALDNPSERIEELLLKSLFKNHPVNRPVGGFPKTVKRLTLDQIINAHQINYTSHNMILILTGNFSKEDEAFVLKNFKDRSFEKPLPRKIFSVETTKPVPLVVEEKSGIAQTYLSIGARTVCSSHHDVPTLDVMSALLSGGTSSRLFIELREKHALTYDVNSDHNKGMDFGYFSINCAVKNKNLAKAKRVILKELTKLRTEKVPVDELEKTKNLIVGASLRGMDDPQDCSEILAYMEMQFKSEKALVDHVAKVKAVSSDNILEAANVYLQEDCLATVILKSKESD
jgi:predicted Zn-dependent peptidase